MRVPARGTASWPQQQGGYHNPVLQPAGPCRPSQAHSSCAWRPLSSQVTLGPLQVPQDVVLVEAPCGHGEDEHLSPSHEQEDRGHAGTGTQLLRLQFDSAPSKMPAAPFDTSSWQHAAAAQNGVHTPPAEQVPSVAAGAHAAGVVAEQPAAAWTGVAELPGGQAVVGDAALATTSPRRTRRRGATAAQAAAAAADGQTPVQPQLLPASEQDIEARLLTVRLKQCSCWGDIVAALQHYAVQRGSLPVAQLQQQQQQQLGGDGDMPEPLLLLQPLNARHLVALWWALGKVVRRAGSGPVPAAGPQGQGHRPHGSSSSSSQLGMLSGIDDDESDGEEDGFSSSSNSRGCSMPLSRGELVALRRLLAKLEQVSLRAMAGGAWSGSDAVAAMWAMGHLGHTPSNRWLPTWTACTLPSVPQMWARHLAKAMWGLAASGLPPHPEWLALAVQRIVHVATRNFTRLKLKPPAYASVLWSIAKLEVASLTAAAQHSQHAPQHMQHSSASASGEQLQQGLQMGRPASRPSLTVEQLAQYLERAMRVLPRMEPHHVSMMLWSLGHLAAAGHPAAQCLVTGPSMLQHPCRSEGSWQQAAAQQLGAEQQLQASVDKLWRAAVKLGPSALGPQGTANVLWAAAHLGVRLPPVAPQLQPQYAASNGVHTSNGVHAEPAQQQQGGSRMAAAHAAVLQLAQESVGVVAAMSPQQLYNSVWALATLQVTPSQPWVHALLAASRPQLPGFEVQALVGVLWSCAKLHIKPGPVWMAGAMRALDARGASLCPVSLPLLLWSLAQLGYQPGLAWTKALTSRTARLLAHMDTQGLAMCVHGLAKLRLPAHPAWCTAFKVCLEAQLTAAAGQLPQPAHMAEATCSTSQQQQQQQQGAHTEPHGLHPRGDVAGAGAQQPAAAARSRRLWQQQPGRIAARAATAAAAATAPAARQVLVAPQELAAALQGMARLGIEPTAGLLEAAEKLLGQWVQSGSTVSVMSGRHELNTRHLSGCLYGLARLGCPAQDATLSACADACISLARQQLQAAASPPPAQQQQAGLGAHSHPAGATLPDVQLRWLAVDVAQACWSVAMLGHTPSHTQLCDLEEVTLQLLPHMGLAELAQVTWAVQRMGLAAPKPAWAETLLAVSEQHLRRLVQQHYRPVAAPCMDGAAMATTEPAAVAGGAPLLSVATLLRVLAQWGGAADAPGRTSQPQLHVSRGWLEAASLVVEAEAQLQPATVEGPLPTAAQLSAALLPSESAEVLHGSSPGALSPCTGDSHTAATAATPRPMSPGLPELLQPPEPPHGRQLSVSAGSSPAPAPGPRVPLPLDPASAVPYTASAASMQDGPAVMGLPAAAELLGGANRAAAGLPGPRALPFVQEQARAATLSASEVSLGRKAARKRLWRGHRMHVLQHHRVVQASRCALRQLLAACAFGSDAETCAGSHE